MQGPVGGTWLRGRRSHVSFRDSPAPWFSGNTFVSEEPCGAKIHRGETFYHFPKVLSDKRRLGSDFFHAYGFHDPEILGSTNNWDNRGDCFFAAQNRGGFEAARRGIEAIHRAGGHVIYYVEGLIMWKRSRGTYDEHYRGYWHLHRQMRDYNSWCRESIPDPHGIQRTVQAMHLWNAVHGYRIYAYNPHAGAMEGLSTRVRHYYDLYPEICDNPISEGS